jgi:hypothetical protein
MRREAGFELADRITTWVGGDAEVARVVASQGDYIRGETLTTDLITAAPPAGVHGAEQDLEGTRVTLGVRRN